MDRPSLSEAELLGRLGLSGGASEDQVETAHAEIVAFLEGAPADMRAWARHQIAAADEAYALLSDRGMAIEEPRSPTPAPATRPARDQAATAARRARTTAATFSEPAPTSFLGRIGPLGRMLMGAGAIAAVLVIGYVIYISDLPAVPGLNGTPAPQSTQAAIDTARVAQLMQAIQANPNDVAALQELGTIYFDAGQYQVAAQWEQRIIDVDPTNALAHLALGAALYNLGNDADAEAQWRAVIDLNPSEVNLVAEAHYDLGFMYFSAVPPDIDRTITEWQAVIAIAPDSDIARTAQIHLQQLASPSPSGSSSPSGSPGASGSPAASTPPSQAPSPTASVGPSTSP